MSLRQTWSTKQVPEQSRLHSESLSRKIKQKTKQYGGPEPVTGVVEQRLTGSTRIQKTGQGCTLFVEDEIGK